VADSVAVHLDQDIDTAVVKENDNCFECRNIQPCNYRPADPAMRGRGAKGQRDSLPLGIFLALGPKTSPGQGAHIVFSAGAEFEVTPLETYKFSY